MFAAAIGAFHQQEIHVGHRHRVAQDFVRAAPDVAGEQKTLFFAVRMIVHFQQHLRAAEDMAGIDERGRHAVRHRDRAVVADRHELAQTSLRVLFAVEGTHRLEAVLFPVFVQPVDIALLDPRAVRQHDLAKVAGGVRGVDVSRETLAGQIRQVAAVVDVGVRQNHHVDRLRVEIRETTVHLVGELARSLIEPAIEQDALAVDLQQMLRAGGGAGRTAKFQFHGFFRFGGNRITDYPNLSEKTKESRPLASNCARRDVGRSSTVAGS